MVSVNVIHFIHYIQHSIHLENFPIVKDCELLYLIFVLFELVWNFIGSSKGICFPFGL